MLQRNYSDDRATIMIMEGFFTVLPNELQPALHVRTLEDPGLYSPLDSMQVGAFTKAIQYEDPPGRPQNFESCSTGNKYPAAPMLIFSMINENLKAATLFSRKKRMTFWVNWFITAKEDIFIDFRFHFISNANVSLEIKKARSYAYWPFFKHLAILGFLLTFFY